MDILLVASEAAPYSKSGGLGDVVGALGPVLARRGHRVLTVTPAYGHLAGVRRGAEPVGPAIDIHAAGSAHPIGFEALVADGVTHAFVRSPLFERGGLYGDAGGTFGDNHLRFLLLVHGALLAARTVPLADGDPLGERIVVHAHDWQSALAPIVLEAAHRPYGRFTRAASVLTVHNLVHQGRFGAGLFADLALPPRWFSPDALEWYGDINLLKAGLLHADRITTVSPTYAREITTNFGGAGLHAVLAARQEHLVGILNGIDTDVWGPEDDPYLAVPYTAADLAGKARCKGSLQSELGLPIDSRAPMVGFVGRLDPQKGIELILESIPWLVQEQNAQVVLLGSAVPAHAFYEDRLRAMAHAFPRNVRAWIGYDEGVAHRIEAGADLFVMPSRFEPCGLNQLYSLRYGTPPVVHATGGLADSIFPVDAFGTRGNGWRFDRFDGHALRTALWEALDCWRNRPQAFDRIRRRGMAEDHSWDGRIGAYEAVYEAALAER